MGTWGTGLYQNDLSGDVKADYIAKLKAGKSDEEALQEILSYYEEESEDDDCKYDFYLGLADTLWEKGRLTEEIKTIALEMIEEEKNSEIWESEKFRKERERVLDKLKEKLNSKMPERKKVPIHKPYKLGWEEGQVYTFQIKEEIKGYEKYVGWHALFYVDKIYTEDWQVRGVWDEIADLFFFLRKDKPESVEDIYTSKNVCFIKIEDGNRYGVYIYESSKRGRPKDLTLLGKCNSFVYPENDTIRKAVFTWSTPVYQREILRGYENQIKYENGL